MTIRAVTNYYGFNTTLNAGVIADRLLASDENFNVQLTGGADFNAFFGDHPTVANKSCIILPCMNAFPTTKSHIAIYPKDAPNQVTHKNVIGFKVKYDDLSGSNPTAHNFICAVGASNDRQTGLPLEFNMTSGVEYLVEVVVRNGITKFYVNKALIHSSTAVTGNTVVYIGVCDLSLNITKALWYGKVTITDLFQSVDLIATDDLAVMAGPLDVRHYKPVAMTGGAGWEIRTGELVPAVKTDTSLFNALTMQNTGIAIENTRLAGTANDGTPIELSYQVPAGTYRGIQLGVLGNRASTDTGRLKLSLKDQNDNVIKSHNSSTISSSVGKFTAVNSQVVEGVFSSQDIAGYKNTIQSVDPLTI